MTSGTHSQLVTQLGGSMFERFTDRARTAVVLAQEEARMLKQNWIGTEHILLGLVHEHEGVAAQTLMATDVSLEKARIVVESMHGIGAETPEGHIPFTPRGKKALELSLREALTLGHNYIGTEHVLLGLLRQAISDGSGFSQVLSGLQVNPLRLRKQCLENIGFDAADKLRTRLEEELELLETVSLPRVRTELESLTQRRDQVALLLAGSWQ